MTRKDSRLNAAIRELKRIGAAHAAGDALAACYAPIGARIAGITEQAAFDALAKMPDAQKSVALKRWAKDPFSVFADLS